jgi:hypothetical protein
VLLIQMGLDPGTRQAMVDRLLAVLTGYTLYKYRRRITADSTTNCLTKRPGSEPLYIEKMYWAGGHIRMVLSFP